MTTLDSPARPKLRPWRAARRGFGAVPRPLAILLAVVTVLMLLWALVIPMWGGPDEDVHFSYVQTLAERHELPGKGPQSVSTEQLTSSRFSNTDAVVFFPYATPDWSRATDAAWRVAARDAPREDGGAYNAASAYPATYYALDALAYDLAGSGSSFATRFYAVRVLSGLWLLVTTAAAWLLAGEVFGRRRTLQLVTAAATGLWPMTAFLTTKVNPDAMIIALYTLTLWLGASIIKRGVSFGRAAALCAVVGVALATKATALALLPAAGLALLVGAWRLRARVSWGAVARTAVVIAALALPVAVWIGVARSEGRTAYAQVTEVSSVDTGSSTKPGGAAGGVAPASSSAPAAKPFSVSEFASYLWQFYLPRLPSQNEIDFLYPVFSHKAAFQTFLGGSWANFGWANVWFPRGVYFGFFAVVLLALGAALLVGVRGLRARRAAGRGFRPGPNAALGAFFALVVAGLVGGLHWTDFHFYLTKGAPFLQGRYLLPLGAVFALVLAVATRAAPVRFRPAAAGAVLAGLVILNLLCLGLVIDRYYA